MKEKFRLRCDLNEITDINNMDEVAEQLEKFKNIQTYHRYSYLFHGYHDLVHGKIDDETFFALGDISSEKPLFTHAHKLGLESVFAIAGHIEKDTLYIVETSAREYYIGKVGSADELSKEMLVHGSHIIISA